MTKLFNADVKTIQEDKQINGLVVEMVAGNVEAGEQFAGIIEKKMTNKVRKAFTGQMSKEDALQEFLLKAIEVAYKWDEDKHGNYMGYLYKSITRKQIDEARKENAQKRKKTFEVNGETVSRELSLQTPIGEDGDASFGDKVSGEQVSVEEMVDSKTESVKVATVVKDFIASTKGRNGQIVSVVYAGMNAGLSDDEINVEIGKLLNTDKKPNIRKAKQRAMDALELAIVESIKL